MNSYAKSVKKSIVLSFVFLLLLYARNVTQLMKSSNQRNWEDKALWNRNQKKRSTKQKNRNTTFQIHYLIDAAVATNTPSPPTRDQYASILHVKGITHCALSAINISNL